MRTLLAALLWVQTLGGAAEPPTVVIVPIVDEIDVRNMALVHRAVKEILAKKPDLVIFEIDTPGGRVDYMILMGEAMMSLAPIPTVSFVRPQGSVLSGAISAGAYLAISSKKLYMYPGTVIGASAPVIATGEGMKAVEEKGVSAIREKFRARADQNGYPPMLMVAMVDVDVELFEVEVDGTQRFLTAGEIEKLKMEGKEFVVPTIPFDSKEKLLTLTDRQVVRAGMGRIASSREEIYKDHGLSAPREIRIDPSWSENMAGLLTSGFVHMALLAVGVIGLWVEFKSPGFGIPGLVGILALGLWLFGHHLAGLAQVGDIALIVLGAALVIVELVFFPGVGFLVVPGILCILAGLVLSVQGFTIPDVKGAPWEVDILFSSIGRILSSLTIGVGGVLVVLRFLPKVPMANRLVLQTTIGATAPVAAGIAALVGRKGHAVTALRPGGRMDVDGQIVDVVSEGEFVAQGEPVEVLRVEGMRVVVGRTKR